MTTTYYADFDLATGDNDGTTQANAWQTLQRAIDGTDGTQPGAGDIVLCKGSLTVTEVTVFDGEVGDTSSGPVFFIGTNSSWVIDGTRAEIDGNGGTFDLLQLDGSDFLVLANFYIHGTTGSGNDGIMSAGYGGSDNVTFINCKISDVDSCINQGSAGMLGSAFIGCYFDPRDDAVAGGGNSRTLFAIGCYLNGGTGSGLTTFYSSQMICIDCYIIDFATDGAKPSGYPGLIYNTTFDGCGDAIESDADIIYAIGNRITNSTMGIRGTKPILPMLSYMPDTGEDRVNTAKTTGLVFETILKGIANNFAGTDTDGGYADPDNDDFNLDQSKATEYNQELDLEA